MEGFNDVKGKEYVSDLIKECKKTGQIKKEQVKGLSEDELRFIVNSIVKGNSTMKSIVFSTMREHI